jgi:uncharacterized membrane protein
MSAPTLQPAPPSRSNGSRPGTTPGIWLLRVIGSVLVLALAVGGAIGLAAGFFQRDVTSTEVLATGTTVLVVDGDVGDVTVRQVLAGEQPRIVRTSHWSFDEPRSQVSQRAGRATVTTDCPPYVGLTSCSVDVLAVLPAGVAVQVRTTTGDVSLRRLDGEVTVDSTTGDVNARQLAADQVSVQTGVGDVSLAFDAAPTSVTARAGTGDVQVAVPTGQTYAVTARSSVGDRTVTVPTADSATHSITATSSLGDVSVVGRSG